MGLIHLGRQEKDAKVEKVQPPAISLFPVHEHKILTLCLGDHRPGAALVVKRGTVEKRRALVLEFVIGKKLDRMLPKQKL